MKNVPLILNLLNEALLINIGIVSFHKILKNAFDLFKRNCVSNSFLYINLV